jgi:hypothetical protein
MEMELCTLFDEKQTTERNTTSNKGGDVNLALTSTQSDQDVWLIELGSSYHMKPHREWFYAYEIYEGGYVFLGDDSTTKSLDGEESDQYCRMGGVEPFQVYYIFHVWKET